MVPDGWHKIDLHHLAEVRTGLAKGKKNISDPVSQPYLRVANVQDGHFDLTDIKSITVNRKDIDRYKVLPDDVLLTEGGDFDKLGRGHVWTGEIRDCLHQNHIFVVRCDSTRLLPRFFAYQTASPHGRSYFLGCSKQTTNLASINSTQLREFPVLLPDLAEQLRIVSVVETWDRAIEQTQKLIDAKLRLKRGLMQQLLTGKLRFEEFRRSSWKEYRIGDLLEEVKRPITFDDTERYDLISVRRRSGGLFHRGALHGHQIETKNLSIAKSGDFLISRMQVVHGASGLTTPEFDGMNISGSYTALVTRDPNVIRIEFFDLLSRTPQLYRLAYLASWGVHIEKMTFSLPLYLKSKIRIPSNVAEQDKIVGLIRAASDEIKKLEESQRLLKEQKRGLMQVLLTGKVRVKTPPSPAAVDHLPDVRKMVGAGTNSRRKAKK